MNNNIKTKFISMGNIISSGGFNIIEVIDVIEKAFIEDIKGEIELPEKISQIFDTVKQNRINCMPATITSEKVCGVKWVSVFPENPKIHNIPNVSGVIILSSLETGFPLAIMDGTLCTLIRTACMGAIGAKYLSKKDSKEIGFIGAGEQAKMHFIAIKTIRPSLKICKVSSRNHASEENFINEMSKRYPDVKFVACYGDNDMASTNSDIIVTAISAQLPLLKAKTIKEGAFYCHVGGYEDEYEVALKADKIVCDRWECVKHRSQTISRMYKEKILLDKDIYANIDEIITGEKLARENDKEFIYYNTVGLSFLDVAISNYFYKLTCKKGNYLDLNLTEGSVFDKI